MIARIWHGWTSEEDADSYEKLLKTEIFPGIAAKGVSGFRGVELLRRPVTDKGEVEFMTVMRFDTWDAVAEFAGEDFERAYVPPAARAILKQSDSRSAHFEVRGHHGPGAGVA